MLDWNDTDTDPPTDEPCETLRADGKSTALLRWTLAVWLLVNRSSAMMAVMLVCVVSDVDSDIDVDVIMDGLDNPPAFPFGPAAAADEEDDD